MRDAAISWPGAVYSLDIGTVGTEGVLASGDPCARRGMRGWTRAALGVPTPHATAAEAHNRLMLTKALDLSPRCKAVVPATRGE